MNTKNIPENVTLDIDTSGHVYPKNQVTDYILRGDFLESMNVLDFFVETYEVKVAVEALVGRLASKRVPYLETHPRYSRAARKLRQKGHNNLPNFIGQYFPRADDEDVQEFYCACMLVLLKPWRNLSMDLKTFDETWEEAFQSFHHRSSITIHNIIIGIQFFHECESAAAA